MSVDVAERTAINGLDMPVSEPQAMVGTQPVTARTAQVVRPLGAPPQKIELNNERMVIRHSDELDQLFAAMAKAQGMYENLERTRTARIKSRKEGGADYSFDHETLADVIAATTKGLSENGLTCLQFPFTFTQAQGSGVALMVRTLLGHASGQWISNDLVAAVDDGQPRSIASGITYLCRYGRKSICGIAAEYDDDDGERASGQAAGQRAAPQPARRQARPETAPAPAVAAPKPAAPPQATAPASAAPVAASQPAAAQELQVLHTGLLEKVWKALQQPGQPDVFVVRLTDGWQAATRSVALHEQATALRGTKVVLHGLPAAEGRVPIYQRIEAAVDGQ